MLATGWLCAVTLPTLNAHADPSEPVRPLPVSLEASDTLGRVIFALREAQMDEIASAPRNTPSVKLDAGDAARVDPRGWLRRWHQRGLLQPVSAALADSNP